MSQYYSCPLAQKCYETAGRMKDNANLAETQELRQARLNVALAWKKAAYVIERIEMNVSKYEKLHKY